LNVSVSLNATTGEVVLTPPANFTGTNYIIFNASDGINTTQSNNVTITVAPLSTLINSWLDSIYYANTTAYNGLSVYNSNIADSNVTNSTVTASTVDNSTVIDSTLNLCNVLDSYLIGANCYNQTIDPSDIRYADVSGSTITNSHVWYANATNSVITAASIDNASVDNSVLNNVSISSNAVVTNSAINNTEIPANTTISDATIVNSIIQNGTIVMYNGTVYNASVSGAMNLTSLVNYEPQADFSYSANYLAVTFTDSSVDLNVQAGTLNDTLTYLWQFGDGSNSAFQSPAHTYAAVGTYNVILTATDSHNGADSKTASITVAAQPAVQAASSGGSGGGGSHCAIKWNCTEWSGCSEEGKKTRDCVDLNKCGSTLGKPSEEDSCTHVPLEAPETEEEGNATANETIEQETAAGGIIGITGRVIGGAISLGEQHPIIAAFFILIVVGLAITLYSNLRNSKKRKGKLGEGNAVHKRVEAAHSRVERQHNKKNNGVIRVVKKNK